MDHVTSFSHVKSKQLAHSKVHAGPCRMMQNASMDLVGYHRLPIGIFPIFILVNNQDHKLAPCDRGLKSRYSAGMMAAQSCRKYQQKEHKMPQK